MSQISFNKGKVSKDKKIDWSKIDRNNLPHGDWIVSHKDSKNNIILISRDDFLEQLEIRVNN
ncbi:hypothetical protein GCM10022259_17550 [Aquimarina mytili]